MFRPYDMSSVLIAGPKNVQEDVIKEFYNQGVLHILEHSKSEMADIGTPLDGAGKLSEILVKARALKSSLQITESENKKFDFKKELLDIEYTIEKITSQVNETAESLKAIEEERNKLVILRQELEILKDIPVPLEQFTEYKSIAYFTGFVKSEIPILREQLDKKTKNYELYNSTVRNNSFIALFVDKNFEEKIRSILNKEGFAQVNFGNIEVFEGTAKNNLKNTEKEYQKIEEQQKRALEKLSVLSKEYGGFLNAAELFLKIQLEKANAPLKFASTKSSFIAKGWIPTENLDSSIKKINSAAKNKIYIHSDSAKISDDVPIKLKNSKIVKPFEFFINLYSLPSFKELDPTFFIFLTFPIFFGIMLGDMGYGLVSLSLFWIMKRKMPKMSGIMNVLMLASFFSIIFGFLYGEIFGLEEIGHYHIWHVLSRSHDMFTLMYIVLALGVIHVNIGIILGFINAYRGHGLKMALFEKASWIVLQLGVSLLVLSYMEILSISVLSGYIFLAAAIVMIYKGEGVKGIMELPAVFTNVLSYIRLMAIGLSSVTLALIINESAAPMFQKGGVFIIAGVLIIIIGHILNIILGLFGSFLHSLRLHYVEFFSKFFQGGAKKYEPFGLKEE